MHVILVSLLVLLVLALAVSLMAGAIVNRGN